MDIFVLYELQIVSCGMLAMLRGLGTPSQGLTNRSAIVYNEHRVQTIRHLNYFAAVFLDADREIIT